jgi:hypothetical protein
MESALTPLTPEMIERFRQVGLRLDRNGRLWHQESEVTHPRIRQALLRWLDLRAEDGRPIIRLDDKRYAYVDVEDAHLQVTSAHWDGDRVELGLDDGTEEELAYDTLRAGGDDALYCAVRGGKLIARISTRPYYAIAERIEEDPPQSGNFVLRAAGRRFPIGHR